MCLHRRHRLARAFCTLQELASLGRRQGLCPYYGARSLVWEADVVVAPYSCVLSHDTRVALGLDLQGAVVVFDEAHNLVSWVRCTVSSEDCKSQENHHLLLGCQRRPEGAHGRQV